ncbi:MAG: hypothetical protein AB2812_05420 [Candidatus Sedimenticola endophacoides]
MDFDPQRSSSQWLEQRAGELPPIRAIDATRPSLGTTRTWQLYSGNGTDIVIKDTPAGLTGNRLTELFNRADTVLIPVMNSVIDLNALDAFIIEIRRLMKMGRKEKRIGLIANRARINSTAYKRIQEIAESNDIPLVATLHDTQCYPLAMEAGMSVWDHQKSPSAKDRKQIRSLLDWIHEAVPKSGKRAVPEPEEERPGEESQWSGERLPPFAMG